MVEDVEISVPVRMADLRLLEVKYKCSVLEEDLNNIFFDFFSNLQKRFSAL